MNRTKTLAAALLLAVLPLTSTAFASDRDYAERGRGHNSGHEYDRDEDRHYGHHRPHYRHYDRHHSRHHYRHYDYRHGHGGHEDRGWEDRRASVTLPFPPLPPFPVIIFDKHHR